MSAEQFYAACKLTTNPFRSNAVTEDDPRVKIWVGYDRQRLQLEKILDRVRADQVGLTNFVLLYGAYGTGKSHALLWARNRVKETGGGVAYFVPTLKKDKGKLSFAAAFAEDLIARGSLLRDLMRFRTFLETLIVQAKQGQEMTNEAAIDRLIKSREHAEFVKGLMGCQTDNAIKEYLNPGKLLDYQAAMLFAKIVNLFVQKFDMGGSESRFTQAVYLFIDELDDLQRQPPKETLETNDILRHLYDACPNSFGLVCALSAEVTTLTNMFTDYVLSRVTRQVHFDLLDRDAAIDFVKNILEKSRPPGAVVPSAFFPFDEDSVNAVMSQLREITPRKVVNTMQQVTEECRIAEANPAAGPITPDILDELGVLDSVFGDGSSN
jgi:AAA ATPase domain